MKSPFVILTSLVLVLGLTGLAAWKGEVIALAVPLVAYVIYAIQRQPEAGQLSVDHNLSQSRVQAETKVKIKVILQATDFSADEIHVEEHLPAGLVRDGGQLELLFSPDIRENLEWEYDITVKRGDYRAIETHFWGVDGSGCFETRSILQTALGLTAHPEYISAGSLRIRPPQTRGFAGPIPARQAGSGVDFFGLREYQNGDPPRQINWRKLAHGSNGLFTNIYEQERVADVGIILDSRQAVNQDGPRGSLFEQCVSAAASLADSFLADGNRVGMVVYGSGMESVFPGYGRRQRNRILCVLARVKSGVNFALNSLNYLPTRMFPSRSQIVLISPLLPEDAGVISRMRARGYAVLVVSPDPVRFETGPMMDNPETAIRLARAERTLLLQQIRRAGVQVVDWEAGSPLEIPLRRELSGREMAGFRPGGFR